LIDVRTPEEYITGHLPGSKLLNIMNPNFRKIIQKMDREQPYYIYCRNGNRSASACNIMARYGFKTLFNLEKGLLAWKGHLEF